jgi:hypothetical protein
MLALALAVPPTLSNPPSYGPGHSLCASSTTRLPARPLLYPFASLSTRRRLPARPLLYRCASLSTLYRPTLLITCFSSTRSLRCRPAGACLLARFGHGRERRRRDRIREGKEAGFEKEKRPDSRRKRGQIREGKEAGFEKTKADVRSHTKGCVKSNY